MSDSKKLVVVITNGFNDERASVAWSVANGGIASGFEVTFAELSVYGDGDEIEPVWIRQPEEFLAWWANPERAFVNLLLCEDIVAALERLPEAFRIVVLLINVEGLSYDEAAQVLDVSPGTIRSRINRGRTLLQRELWEHAKDAGLMTETTMERGKP